MSNKRSNQWIRERKKLKEIYFERDIIKCEVRIKEKCMRDFALSFHHRHKRVWYYDYPELLGEFDETILVCAYCHGELEKNKMLSRKAFNKLRKVDF